MLASVGLFGNLTPAPGDEVGAAYLQIHGAGRHPTTAQQRTSRSPPGRGQSARLVRTTLDSALVQRGRRALQLARRLVEGERATHALPRTAGEPATNRESDTSVKSQSESDGSINSQSESEASINSQSESEASLNSQSESEASINSQSESEASINSQSEKEKAKLK